MASDYFPQIHDTHQTIESKISTQIGVTPSVFFSWFEKGTMLSELTQRHELTVDDRRIFEELLNGEVLNSNGHNQSDSLEALALPEEIDEDEDLLIEGAATTKSINAYERDPAARRRRIEHYGAVCSVPTCQFNFRHKYGSLGEGYIHIHHLTPLSEIRDAHDVDPIRDLRPVCPNCHAMIHKRNPPFTIEELSDIVRNAN